jgi:hypothetical protein
MFGFGTLGYYSPLLALQAFCLFHAYKNNNQQKWFYLIIFLPGIGSALYLYETFYSRQNVDSLSETFKSVFIADYDLKRLEREHRFSETITNKMNLADAYTSKARYKEAIALYESCKKPDIATQSPDLLRKLLMAYYLNKDYEAVEQCGLALESNPKFNSWEEKIGYAWALYQLHKDEKAEKTFQEMDLQFSHYRQKLEYCKFLKITNQKAKAKEKLGRYLEEFEAMDGYERNLKKAVMQEIKQLRRTL